MTAAKRIFDRKVNVDKRLNNSFWKPEHQQEISLSHAPKSFESEKKYAILLIVSRVIMFVWQQGKRKSMKCPNINLGQRTRVW